MPPSANNATSLRRREVTFSRISFYIVFVFLFCHSIRTIPNLYEVANKYLFPVSTKIRVALSLFALTER